jgi:hypothetical protein
LSFDCIFRIEIFEIQFQSIKKLKIDTKLEKINVIKIYIAIKKINAMKNHNSPYSNQRVSHISKLNIKYD